VATKPDPDVATEWPPQWTDADGLLLREYADTPKVHIEGHRVRCSVGNSSTFISWFIPIFGVVFIAVVYPTIDVPKFKALFLLVAPLSLVSVFAIAYGFARYHEKLGDYLVADLLGRSFDLPRYNETFDLASIVCFQYISGYKHPFSRNLKRHWSRQINVLVWRNDELARYHLIGNPRKKIVHDIADSIGIPLIETSCPSGYFLCSDRNGHG
jgi:hypothetical protein